MSFVHNFSPRSVRFMSTNVSHNSRYLQQHSQFLSPEPQTYAEVGHIYGRIWNEHISCAGNCSVADPGGRAI
jgi:hypothetical protein